MSWTIRIIVVYKDNTSDIVIKYKYYILLVIIAYLNVFLKCSEHLLFVTLNEVCTYKHISFDSIDTNEILKYSN